MNILIGKASRVGYIKLSAKYKYYFSWIIILVAVPQNSYSDSPSILPISEIVVPYKTIAKTAGDKTIRNIIFSIGDVFDPRIPEENRFLFRLANKLHNKSKQRIIQQQLLFKEGDIYSERLIEESERILRKNNYIASAKIIPVYQDGKYVDLEVITRDSWSLTGGISFGRSGGVNKSSFEIDEKNFLGLGKNLMFVQINGVDRNETQYFYDDKNIAGTHYTGSLLYSDNSDGTSKSIELGRPFYGLDSRWSADAKFMKDKKIDSIYSFGKIVGSFEHQHEYYEISTGISDGYNDSRVFQWNYGFTVEKDRYLSNSSVYTPDNRNLHYPWVSLKYIHDDNIKTRHVRMLHRIEDVNLGMEIESMIGLPANKLGSSDNGIIFNFKWHNTFLPTSKQLILFLQKYELNYIDGKFENSIAELDYKHYIYNFYNQIFYLNINGQRGYNLDITNNLLLGGDSGLRGYPLRFQEGDRRLLVTLEQRLYTNWHWFELLRVGGVMFYDVGRAWSSNTINNENTGYLSDIGLGIRFTSSRSASGLVIQFDLAFPLDGDSSIAKRQFLITSSKSF